MPPLMAKGYDKHQERMEAIQGLGRSLARRARSTCELCEESGIPLHVREVPPLPEEPEADRAVMVCERCGAAIGGAKLEPSAEYRFLEGVVWSDMPTIQVCAVRLLGRLAEQGVEWATDTLDGLYLDPEVQEWVDGG